MNIFIIAEIGINHNGNLSIAKDLIEVAQEAGCNAVKFQKRDIDKVYTQKLLDSPRESPWGTTQRDQKMGLEFGEHEYREIDLYCKSKSIEWFASAWDMNSQSFLRQFDCKFNKVASAMIVNEKLLEAIAEEKKTYFHINGDDDLRRYSKSN
jgi:N-acetylneuraminate synthase